MALAHSPKIVKDGLVLCLDAANSKSYPGSGTTWTDLSGNENNGTLINGPTYNSNNLGSFSFDGVDDYATTPFNSLLTNISISAWFKAPQQSSNPASILRPIFIIGAPGTQFEQFEASLIRAGSPDVGKLRASIGKDTLIFISNNRYDDDQWHNVVLVKDNNTLVFYVDGIKLVEKTGDNNNLYDISVPLHLAADLANTARRLIGKISQVAVYNRSITEAEVKQNFNALRGRYGI